MLRTAQRQRSARSNNQPRIHFVGVKASDVDLHHVIVSDGHAGRGNSLPKSWIDHQPGTIPRQLAWIRTDGDVFDERLLSHCKTHDWKAHASTCLD